MIDIVCASAGSMARRSISKSLIITNQHVHKGKDKLVVTRDRPPIHPGITLKEDVMEELDLNASAVGRILGIPANRISEIVRGRRAITADTALRHSEWLGTSPEFWMRLQEKYDLERTRMERGEEIRRQVTERRAITVATG